MGIKEDAERIKKWLEEMEKEKLHIALFGQPGAGKSSIINLIVGKEFADTGVSTDVTKEAQFVKYQDMLLVDLPGYGTSKFPPNEWMDKFKPKNFDLFLCVFSGKFHYADTNFFKELKEDGRVCLFVRNKHDDIWGKSKTKEQLEEEIIEDVAKQVGLEQKVYFVSCKEEYGLDRLQEGISEALEPAKREKYARSAKSYTVEHLQAKKATCEKLVTKYAALSAANALNPVPGVDIGVDVGLLLKLFSSIRNSFGLTDDGLHSVAPALAPLANNILKYATKEGIFLLLKRFATRQMVKRFSKYIPIVGQSIAASAGFAITKTAGDSYLEDCYELAEKILFEELKVR